MLTALHLRLRLAIVHGVLGLATVVVSSPGGAALGAQSPGGAMHGDAASLLERARLNVQHGDLPAAEDAVKASLAAEPDSPDGMYLLAHVLEGRKQAEASLGWFTRAARVRPPDAEDLRVVAMDYVLLHDYIDAQHWLERSVAMEPGNAEAWYDLGRARMMEGKFPEAGVALRTALGKSPRMVKAENNLGVVLEAENDTAGAALAYRTAIAWQAQDRAPSEQPLLNLGVLLLTQGRSDEALPYLSQAVAIAPSDQRCHEQLARALDRQNRGAEAVREMSRAIELAPASAGLHYQLGQIYRRMGQAEKARQEMLLSGQMYGSRASEGDH